MAFKIERLQQVIRLKVTMVLQRDISDPRLGLMTVTYVKLSRDLKYCTVGYSVMGGPGDRSKCQHALDDCKRFIQREVAGALKTRVTPQLEFEFDESIEGSARIAELLRDVLPEPTGPEADGDETLESSPEPSEG